MPKHEFYADPTLFDQWQEEAGNWFSCRLEKLYPYAWSLGFAALGLVFLSTAAGILVTLLQQNLFGAGSTATSRLLAQVVTLAIALVAAQYLFRQALDAWPEQAAMPVQLHVLVRWLGFDVPAPVGTEKSVQAGARKEQRVRPLSVAERQAAQEFLAGVRAAGVNVTIARALYAAGIRSARHLQLARDGQLRRIHGVGPATVRRLRVHFG